MATKLSTKDLDAALAVIRAASASDGSHPFELPVIEQLTQLVPADQAGYFEYRMFAVDAYSPKTTRNIHLVKEPEPSSTGAATRSVRRCRPGRSTTHT
jgi:hypothetical protein